jgi:hypothetical protein
LTLFVVAAKAKQKHGKKSNKNTGLFINCMDFVVVRTKINKKKNWQFFFGMLEEQQPLVGPMKKNHHHNRPFDAEETKCRNVDAV